MSSQKIPAQTNRDTIQTAHRFALDQMHIGVPRQMIERKLIEDGMDQEFAQSVVAGADEFFIADQMKKGVPTRMIERKLIEAGMDQESAQTQVAGVELQRQEIAAILQKDDAVMFMYIVIGFVLLAVGGGITMWTIG